jgi:hypothetical protein
MGLSVLSTPVLDVQSVSPVLAIQSAAPKLVVQFVVLPETKD